MKIHILVLLLFVSVASGIAQTTETEWQQAAIKQFPDLGVKDSPLNKQFVSAHKRLKASEPDFFLNPQWPLVLARQCAEQLLPPLRFTAASTGDVIEFGIQSFEAGNGTCTLIHKGIRASARFKVDEDDQQKAMVMVVTPETGDPIKLTIGQSGLAGAQTYAWPPGVWNTLEQNGKLSRSLSNAQQIATGCLLYAGDHNGAFPKTLNQMVPEYLPEPAIFVCPLSPNEPIGFEYFGGKDSDPKDEVLLRSKGTTSDERRVIVYKGGKGKIKHEK